MNIDLPQALQRYVDNQVKGGRYLDAGDVVRSVLRRAQAHDHAMPDMSFGEGDLLSLVQLVMMQCARTNADTLRDIMDGLRRSKEGERRPNASVDDVRIQLAEVDLSIKRLLKQLDRKRLEETDERDRIEDQNEQTERLMRDLEKAADAYTEILQTVSSMFAQ